MFSFRRPSRFADVGVSLDCVWFLPASVSSAPFRLWGSGMGLCRFADDIRYCSRKDGLGWHYVSNATCLIRPHLCYALFTVSMITITCQHICYC